MQGMTEKGVAAVVEVLRRFPEVERVWLYGSRARGDAGPRADLDIAVSAPRVRDPSRWAEMAAAVDAADTLLMIDLIRLEEANGRLRGEVLASGRIVYERDEVTAVG